MSFDDAVEREDARHQLTPQGRGGALVELSLGAVVGRAWPRARAGSSQHGGHACAATGSSPTCGSAATAAFPSGFASWGTISPRRGSHAAARSPKH